MPAALTGALGLAGSQLGLLQLGGPVPSFSWSRPLTNITGKSGEVVPYLAHLYGNDGVTANTTTATFPVLNHPALDVMLTNGGYKQLTLEVPAPVSGIALGNVVRLTELGGAYKGFVYSGIVEGLPDTLSATGTKHEIILTPFGAELTRTTVQLLYTSSVDIGQVARDAVAATLHCFVDGVSVNLNTGILISTTSGGTVDFRGQKVNQVLDTIRSVGGPQWYWHCDEMGRVWLQPQGSTAIYTFMLGNHYEERVSNGGDIQDRINQVPAVGGVPTGGSLNVTATANDATSQSLIGVRALDPPIQLPGVSDQATLTAIANGILNTLNQNWNRVQLKGLPPTGQAHEVHPGRVHGSQPGGAMMRYWEPAKNPMGESASGSGYSSTYITQTWQYNGFHQMIEAGNIPITSQTDIDNLVKSWANRAAAISLNITGAALNLQQQVLTGTWQSAATPPAGPAALWSLGQREFAAIDSNGVTRAEMGNLLANGISPAQWGFRANDATGAPLFDSLGVIGVGQILAYFQNINFSLTITSSTFTVVSGLTKTFTLTRQVNILVIACPSAVVTTSGGNGFGYGQIFTDGAAANSDQMSFWPSQLATTQTQTIAVIKTLGAGSHTLDFRVKVDNTGTLTWTNQGCSLIILQLGG